VKQPNLMFQGFARNTVGGGRESYGSTQQYETRGVNLVLTRKREITTTDVVTLLWPLACGDVITVSVMTRMAAAVRKPFDS